MLARGPLRQALLPGRLLLSLPLTRFRTRTEEEHKEELAKMKRGQAEQAGSGMALSVTCTDYGATLYFVYSPLTLSQSRGEVGQSPRKT